MFGTRQNTIESTGGTITGMTTFETVRLQPPTFSGKPEDWTTFWAYFKRAEGSPARRAVEVYPPSDGNYPVVVQLLKERFGDTDDLQRAIRARLLHLAPAKDNVNSQTTMIDEFERISLEENLSALQTRLGRIKGELSLANTYCNELRSACESWSDLLKSYIGHDDEQKKEDEYTAFLNKFNITKCHAEANQYLLDLMNLEKKIVAEVANLRLLVDKKIKQEAVDHSKQIAGTYKSVPSMPTITCTPPTLPPLRAFKGNIADWSEWHETFRFQIELKVTDDVEKLLHLKGLLEGEARELISGIKLEAANFNVAMQLLRDTYGVVIDIRLVQWLFYWVINDLISPMSGS
ncbi:hypothetical protein niasHS_012398 [Heterodera schachtii]|uniref:Uncharacterized protein n=1 Tax=Heterodera schachtii TaxID=97005 RepID=A0ABD2ILI1_HETSC